MSAPTPRQQAGYLRRMLRRGEIRVVDPATGRRVPALVELHGQVIRLIPLLDSAENVTSGAQEDAPPSHQALRWSAVQARLRKCMTLADAEVLLAAVEVESGRRGSA